MSRDIAFNQSGAATAVTNQSRYNTPALHRSTTNPHIESARKFRNSPSVKRAVSLHRNSPVMSRTSPVPHRSITPRISPGGTRTSPGGGTARISPKYSTSSLRTRLLSHDRLGIGRSMDDIYASSERDDLFTTPPPSSQTPEPQIMKPDKSPFIGRSRSPHLPRSKSPLLQGSPRVVSRSNPQLAHQTPPASPNKNHLSSISYKPRPRSIATDVGFTRYNTADNGPLSPDYNRSSTSNLLFQAGHRTDGDDVRKWGSCSRIDYNNTPPSQHFQYPHGRTEGDGGPSYNHNIESSYAPYRRHSSSKVSSHSGSTHSDDIIQQQRAELDEKARLIESLRNKVAEQDNYKPQQTERALSDKSGETVPVAESLDSGIDIRSDIGGGMKPNFGQSRTTMSTIERDQRNEINRLKLYIEQLEKRGSPSTNEEVLLEINALRKENQVLSEEKTNINRKFTRIQDYLSTLPTVNEFTNLQEKLAQLTSDNKKLSEEVRKNADDNKETKHKDSELKRYQKKCMELKDSVSKLEKQNGLLKSQNTAHSKQELHKLEQEGSKMAKKVEQLKKEIATLQTQKDNVKNMVDGYYEKYFTEHEKNVILTESLDKSVNEVKVLKSDLNSKTETITTLEVKITELTLQLDHLKVESENKQTRPGQNIFKEFNLAIQDMNNCIAVLTRLINGQNLDISLLLNIGSSPNSDIDTTDMSLDEQLQEVKDMRESIEALHQKIQELYADRAGNQCPTQ